jgi:hypothetical protein
MESCSLLQILQIIFYLEIFEFRKTGFDSNQVGTELNYFEFYLNCSRAHLPFSPLPPSFTNRRDLLYGLAHWPASPALTFLSLFPYLLRARPGGTVPGLPPPDRTRLCPGSPARVHAVARPPLLLHLVAHRPDPPIPLSPRVLPTAKGAPSGLPSSLFTPSQAFFTPRARHPPSTSPLSPSTPSSDRPSHFLHGNLSRRRHGRTTVSSLPRSPQFQIMCASPPPPPHLAVGPA